MEKELYDNYILKHLESHNFRDIKELHKYISDYLFHRSEKRYVLLKKYYRMSVIDAYRYEVRLQKLTNLVNLF